MIDVFIKRQHILTNKMKILKILHILTLAISLNHCLAYGPMEITRRSLLQHSIAPVLIAPSLAAAENYSQNIEEQESVKNTCEVNSHNQFRLSHKRGTHWIQRRLEREKLAQMKVDEREKLAEAITLSMTLSTSNCELVPNDQMPEFRFSHKRGNQWLKRRIEREKLSQIQN